MRYIFAAVLVLAASSLASPADARRHGHRHHRHSHGWYYSAGCHNYYCGGDSVHFGRHRHAYRSRSYYTLGSRARSDYGY